MNQNESQRVTPPQCVLVLEDDPSSRELIKFQLELLGYGTDAYSNGEDGLEQWKAKHHKIVFTDCNLPGISGFEVAAAIRSVECESDAKTTIVGITGYNLEDVAEAYRASGMSSCLAKPVLISDIKEIIPDRREDDAEDVTENIKVQSDLIATTNLAGDRRHNCRALFSVLVESLKKSSSALNDAYGIRSAPDLTSASHRLRSSALAVNANELAEISLDAELAGREENWQKLDLIYPMLQESIKDLLNDATVIFCGDWNTSSESGFCPLAIGGYQPFRASCGQCAFRSRPAACMDGNNIGG